MVYFFFFPPERLAGERGLLCWQGLNEEKPLSPDKNLYMTTTGQDENSQQLCMCRYLHSLLLLLKMSKGKTNTSTGVHCGFAPYYNLI